MQDATVSFAIVPKKMLTQNEAAKRYGRPLKRFKAECPVSPIEFANGDLRYDIDDLDAWIESLKGLMPGTADEIIQRLE